MTEKFGTSTPSDGDDDVEQCSNERHETSEAAASLHPGTMHKVSLSSSCSPDKRRKRPAL